MDWLVTAAGPPVNMGLSDLEPNTPGLDPISSIMVALDSDAAGQDEALLALRQRC